MKITLNRVTFSLQIKEFESTVSNQHMYNLAIISYIGCALSLLGVVFMCSAFLRLG